MRAEHVVARPPAALQPLVTRYVGYHYRGFEPGVHLGLPSASLTVVLSLDDPTLVALRPQTAATGYTCLASGLSTAPAFIEHRGVQYGVQLEMTPLGARSLLGLPAAALADAVVELSDLLGPVTEELVDRMRAAPDWPQRFELLSKFLSLGTGKASPESETLAYAWRRLVHTGGGLRIGELAAETGWSRRHLTSRFTAEYGVTPKDLARIVRFGRSRSLLQQVDRPSLAEVASLCGYYDQPHLALEWRDLAGLAPSAWLASEELPILPSASTGTGEKLVP